MGLVYLILLVILLGITWPILVWLPTALVAFVQSYLAYILAAIAAFWAVLQLDAHIMREKAAKYPDAPPFRMDRASVLMFAVFWAALTWGFVPLVRLLVLKGH